DNGHPIALRSGGRGAPPAAVTPPGSPSLSERAWSSPPPTIVSSAAPRCGTWWRGCRGSATLASTMPATAGTRGSSVAGSKPSPPSSVAHPPSERRRRSDERGSTRPGTAEVERGSGEIHRVRRRGEGGDAVPVGQVVGSRRGAGLLHLQGVGGARGGDGDDVAVRGVLQEDDRLAVDGSGAVRRERVRRRRQLRWEVGDVREAGEVTGIRGAGWDLHPGAPEQGGTGGGGA